MRAKYAGSYLTEITPYADEVKVDAMGSVLVRVHARQQPALKVMLDAHMDEIGFMLVEGGEEGLFRFELIGGIDVRQLPGKSVLVGKDHVPGVIGAKPIHHTTSRRAEKQYPSGQPENRSGPIRQQQGEDRRPRHLRHHLPANRPQPARQSPG